MNLVVTINRAYLKPLCVMLYSLLETHPETEIAVYLVHATLEEEDFSFLHSTLSNPRCQLHSVQVKEDFLPDLPVTFHFSIEMYYRLFACRLLPDTLERALYLDPDMVITGSLLPLYHTPMGDHLFAAAKSPNPITQVEFKRRLEMEEEAVYVNSGVLLMNLKLLRQELDTQAILQYIQENKSNLLLPDQDVLNGMFSPRILVVDYLRYNFDARYFPLEKLKNPSLGKLSQLGKQVSVVHFCGKSKPWQEDYRGELGCLYTEIQDRLFTDKP